MCTKLFGRMIHLRLILIRHGDPDYERDNLTPRGQREAALLADRAASWEVDEAFCSPPGAGEGHRRSDPGGTEHGGLYAGLAPGI